MRPAPATTVMSPPSTFAVQLLSHFRTSTPPGSEVTVRLAGWVPAGILPVPA